MQRVNSTIEYVMEFPRGRVEVRSYDWSLGWNGVQRARPDMYIAELNLSQSGGKDPRFPLESNPALRPFKAGEVSLIPPCSRVQRNLSAGRHRALLCMFDRTTFDQLLPPADGIGHGRVEDLTGPGRTEWLLRNIYREMRQSKDFGSAMVIESFANALAVELARKLAFRRDSSRVRKGGMGPSRMRLLTERVRTSPQAPSLSELANLCGMTVRHLCRAFKEETGATPGQYIAAAQARHAQALLSQTDLSLTEIAHRLGFATSASFSSAFQRVTGLKPRQMKRPA